VPLTEPEVLNLPEHLLFKLVAYALLTLRFTSAVVRGWLGASPRGVSITITLDFTEEEFEDPTGVIRIRK